MGCDVLAGEVKAAGSGTRLGAGQDMEAVHVRRDSGDSYWRRRDEAGDEPHSGGVLRAAKGSAPSCKHWLCRKVSRSVVEGLCHFFLAQLPVSSSSK